MATVKHFGETAKGLAKNPLGIIALFIVLIYGFASLVVGFSGSLEGGEKIPLIWFLVIFPCLVLVIFTWLVSRHHTKLYAPSDYQADEAFIQASQASYQVAFSLGAATAKRAAEGVVIEEIESMTREAANNIARITSSVAERDTKRKDVLWVDDRPDNNVFERQALEPFEIEFVLSTSTESALQKLQERSFDAIISDMDRLTDSRAGYTLLEEMRKNRNSTPFIIYAGSSSPEHVAEARRRGAQGTTNRPDELFEMVLEVVGADRNKG